MKKLIFLALFFNFSWADVLDKEKEIVFDREKKEFCLKAKDIKEIYKNSPSAIHCAALNPNPKFIREVLTAGANLELRDFREETPIFYAAMNKNPEILKFLIQAGADIEARNNRKDTPIFYAIHNKNLEILKVLIETGADFNVRGKKDFTPLFRAIGGNSFEAAKVLVNSGADIHYHPQGLSPITAAILAMAVFKNNDISIVKLLIDKGVNLEAKGVAYEGSTALTMAIDMENVEAVKLLLDSGADIYNNSALYYAQKSKNQEIIKLFEEKIKNKNNFK